LLAALLPTLGAIGCTLQSNIGGPCGAPRNFTTTGSPCREQFYFPTGIAVDPDGDVAYVSSGNADLRYSGGTVASVDLVLFECAMELARHGFPTDASAIDACKGYTAAQLAQIHAFVDPASPTAPDADKGTGCRPDLLDPTIIECDETPFIADAVRVGNFAGSIRVQKPQPSVQCGGAAPDTTPAAVETRRLWLPVRGDPSITFIDVNKAPLGTIHDSGALKPCFSDPSGGDTVSSGVACLQCADTANTQRDRVPDSCDAQRITVRDFPAGSEDPGATCLSDNTTCVPLPADPFGLFLDEGCAIVDCQSADCTATERMSSERYYSRLVVAHLSGGQVTLINSANPTPIATQQEWCTPDGCSQQVIFDVRGGFFNADSLGRRGAFAVAPRVAGNPLSLWYGTSRLNPTVAMFRIADVNLILPVGSFGLSVGNGPFAGGGDVRDLVFDPCTPLPVCPAGQASCCSAINQPCHKDADCCSQTCAPDESGVLRCGDGNIGCRGFFVQENPPSLFTVDTRVEPDRFPAGVPRNQVVDLVDVCQGPAHLAMRQETQPGHEGERPRTLLYAVCFDAGQVAVVDPDLASVVDTVLVGRGPSEIAFNFGPGMPAPAHRRAYITEYVDMNVAVVDLDPGSPTFDRVIGRIGVSQPPPATGSQ
jgi:hypothetical protein